MHLSLLEMLAMDAEMRSLNSLSILTLFSAPVFVFTLIS